MGLSCRLRPAPGCRLTARAHTRLRRLPPPPDYDEHRPGQCIRAFLPGCTKVAAAADSRVHWRVAHEDVRRRRLAGETLGATGLAPARVRKYAGAESFPKRAMRRPGRSILDPFLPYLAKRLGESCEDDAALGGREPHQDGTVDGVQVAGSSTSHHGVRRHTHLRPGAGLARQI